MNLIMPFWKDDEYDRIMFINVVDKADVSTSFIHHIGLDTRLLFAEFAVLNCCPPTSIYEGVFCQQPRGPFCDQKCRRISVSGFPNVVQHYTSLAEKFVKNPEVSCFVLSGKIFVSVHVLGIVAAVLKHNIVLLLNVLLTNFILGPNEYQMSASEFNAFHVATAASWNFTSAAVMPLYDGLGLLPDKVRHSKRGFVIDFPPWVLPAMRDQTKWDELRLCFFVTTALLQRSRRPYGYLLDQWKGLKVRIYTFAYFKAPF
jgi:hypothetical protein